MAELHFFEIL
jgi:small GTP-binding protein